MKQLFTLLLAIPMLTTFSQYTTKSVQTSIDQVTVYLSGAQVSRSEKMQLKKGKTEIIFEGISPLMDPSTIQLKVQDGVRILSISHELNYLNIHVLEPRIKSIKDSLELITDLLQSNSDQQNAYNTEKNMLLQNQSIGGSQSGVNVEELNKARDFFYSNILRINKELSRLSKVNKELTIGSGKLNQTLRELNYTNNNKRYDVKILVETPNDINSLFDLKYLVDRAGWEPVYDIIAKDISSPITLKYKAKAFNNTSINWDKVKLVLSTADPYRSASKPELLTWFLDFDNYRDFRSSGRALNTKRYNDMQVRNSIQAEDNAVAFKEVLVSEVSVDFDIDEPYTIPCNSKPYLIDISESSLNAEYSHFAVPKIERNAFLLARVTGWEDLNLIEGPANIYLDNRYVGKSQINTLNFDDTMDISLGRDQKVLIERNEKKDFRSRSFIGTQRKESYVYEIKLKNMHKSPIQIEIQDQYPISKNGDISVGVQNISNANENEDTGKLTWKFKLDSSELKAYELSYTIRYPKNKRVVTSKKFRTISCPSF